jgi:hypothetical protein
MMNEQAGALARQPDNQDGETNMSRSMRVLAVTAVVAAGVVSLAGGASALPAAGVALGSTAPSNVETVRWGGRGFGPGAFVAGAILGGALLAPRFYGPRPYYYGGGPYYAPGYAPGPYYADPGYADPGPYSADPTGGDPVTYCMQRFRSYDPRSGTYLGFDGYRHPCP